MVITSASEGQLNRIGTQLIDLLNFDLTEPVLRFRVFKYADKASLLSSLTHTQKDVQELSLPQLGLRDSLPTLVLGCHRGVHD